MRAPAAKPALFPYTTLFRSGHMMRRRRREGAHDEGSSTRRQGRPRSEEHTSELQSRFDLVCRLLLEKKKDEDEKKFPNKFENKTVVVDSDYNGETSSSGACT